MQCPTCKAQLPNDSEFCQYCGQRIERGAINAAIEQDKTINSELPITRMQPMNSVGLDENSVFIKDHVREMADGEPREHAEGTVRDDCGPKKNKTKRSKTNVVWIVLLSVLLVIAVVVNIYQYMITNNQSEEIQSLEELLASTQQQLRVKENERIRLRDQYVRLSMDRDAADEVYATLQAFNKSNYGKHADYHADTDVVLVNQGETTRLKVYTTINDDLWLQCSNSNIDADWVSNWNNNYTDVRVSGESVGSATILFTNDANSHEFKVLVIVLP